MDLAVAVGYGTLGQHIGSNQGKWLPQRGTMPWLSPILL